MSDLRISAKSAAGPTADLAETCHCDATAQEAGARHVRLGQLPTRLQFDFYVEGRAERAVAKQLNSYLTDNKLLPRNQSAYRRQHSTETALLRVWSDFLTSADSRRVSLLTAQSD